MKNKTIKKILFAVFAVAICVAAYFAADLAFFQYDDPLARASLTVENDDKDLSFTYDNDAITLHGAEDSTVYALTVEGVKTVEGAYTESLPSDFLGSFAAVRIDTSNDDGDGITEHVYHIAKTDMEYTQGYTTSANVFLSDEIPFEVAYADRDHFTVYLEGETIPNATITVTLANGTTKQVTTDENGNINELNINDVRNGLTFTYIPDEHNRYTLNYQE